MALASTGSTNLKPTNPTPRRRLKATLGHDVVGLLSASKAEVARASTPGRQKPRHRVIGVATPPRAPRQG